MAVPPLYHENAQGQQEAGFRQRRQPPGEPSVKLEGPLFFWIGFIILALVLQLVSKGAIMGHGAAANQLGNILLDISGYIINLPGMLIFPFLVSIWIGERVSKSSSEISKAFMTSLINAAYTALIYAISIFIVFLLLNVSSLNQLTSSGSISMIIFTVLVPVAILFVFITVFSLLAFARRTR